MEALFLKIINMSIAASWVALAVLALRFALKKAPKWITVALWALVAVRLVCPFSFESKLSLVPSAETVPEKIVYAAEPAIESGVEIIDEIVNPVVTGSLAPKTTVNSINPIQVWLFIGGVLWIAGMCILVLYGAVSYLRLRGKVRASICLRDNVYLCDYIDTPFILGIVKPMIYLPSDMDPNAAAHVLAHERAHLRRRDHWWKPLGFALLTLHWFNPILWLSYVLLCRDIEMACDEKVVREMAPVDKKAYSEALLRCSVPRRMIAACPLAFGEVGVKERVKTVLKFKKPAFWVIVVAVAALMVAAVCFLTDPVVDTNGQRKFDLPGPNVSDMDVQEVIKQIRKYNGLKENENPYVNDYAREIILAGNFDYEVVFIPYYYYQNQKTYLSIATFNDLAEKCILMGQDENEWEEQDSIFLLEHYLNALKYMPQAEIQSMLSDPENYIIRFVEEGTPGSYDRVIRYSSEGIGPTDGWLIHLEVIPAYYENGGFPETGEGSVHLFYGEGGPDVNGVVMDAKILEIGNKSYLVEPVRGSWELNSASQIWVQMELTSPFMEAQVGDILRIVYDGQLLETYPAQLGEVFSIEVVTEEYATDMQSASFVYLIDENGKIIDSAYECTIVKNHVYFNDNLDKTGTYSLTSEELMELMVLMKEAPESAITAGAREEDFSQYVVGIDLKFRDSNADEWWATLFYTDGGINLKFYKEQEDGTSVPLDTTYHIRYEPLTEYVRSLCDRSRMENYINIGYPEGNWVEYAYGDASIRLYPLVGWEYEIVPYTDDSTPFGIRCYPNWVEEGSVFVSYWPGGFATCGTGLETEEFEGVIRGYFDGSENWSFQRYTNLPGDYVVLNELPEDYARHADTVVTLLDLDLGGLAERSVQRVSYEFEYINMSMDIWDGWEYEITEYKEGIYNCGIRFRPEGEEGWVNLQWGHFSVPEENRTVVTSRLGNYLVEVGSYRGEPVWRYIYFKEAPDHYALWNEEADSWLAKPEYQQAYQQMLDSIRVAEGIVWKDELLSKIKFKLLWYDYDALYASMSQITGVWSVDLRRDDGTWTFLNFDQEGNLLSSDEGIEDAPTESMAMEGTG